MDIQGLRGLLASGADVESVNDVLYTGLSGIVQIGEILAGGFRRRVHCLLCDSEVLSWERSDAELAFMSAEEMGALNRWTLEAGDRHMCVSRALRGV